VIELGDIQSIFRGHFALNEPLGKYTSFRIGGPADYYLEPADKNDLIAVITYFQQRQFPFMMIGKGSNMLVSDDGVRGAVINLQEGLEHVYADKGAVVVEAGLSISRFVDFCIRNGFKGAEMLAGIPGTIGGAIMMNAGAYGGEISDHIVEVEVLRGGAVTTISKDDAGFTYRHSKFQGDIILGATFRMPAGDTADLMDMRRELMLKRNRVQPVNFPNSGSMFKNPPGNYAARLIEEAGLKGKQQGKAQISEKHANFIVNHGGARAEDVLSLIMLTRETVKKKFNVSLELEVKLVGFQQDVMHEAYS
jgi:UDP-N-acetylmuramate dehydrogenase